MDIKEIGPWKWGKKLPALKEDGVDSIQALQRNMSRLFEDFFGRFNAGWENFPLEVRGSFNPRINVTENEQEIVVTAELPGMDEQDVEVSLSNDLLALKGEKKQEREEEGRDFYRLERSYGGFRRNIALPAEVQADKVEATFKRGVLRIKLPKAPGAQKAAKRIAIRSA
ncbi:MAG: Hsp20/alpha crystallin family protein [Candidatus Lambdaproteobacteria bacterium]|nr:Hsp20/alpha crystallin family protein [Candidatus Lambdaproteobacteria bacterium]